MENTENKQVKISFAAIDRVVTDNIVENIQKEIKGRDMVEYGDKNIYPNYIYDLYQNVSVLHSIVNGISNCFNDITINKEEFKVQINERGDTIEDVAKQILIDLELYGGFALNIVRNVSGGIAGIYNLDFKRIRSNKKNTKFYYSEDWANKSLGRVKTTVYPKYDPNDKEEKNSIYYYKNDRYATYPSPVWCGAVKDAEVLNNISLFNLNSLHNGLSSDYMINFNQGKPTEEDQAEIEEMFDEKYAGFQNARPMLSFNPDLQHRTTVEAIPQNGFADKYAALERTSMQNIYCAFNISPVLLGLPSENVGFNDNDINESWRIAEQLVFKPLLKTVKRTFEYIFQQPDVVDIEITIINFDRESKNNGNEEIE